jgi:hypothetical protein
MNTEQLLQQAADSTIALYFRGMPPVQVRVFADPYFLVNDAVAYCLADTIVFQPNYVKTCSEKKDINSLLNSLKHELIHAWIHWKQIPRDDEYDGHGETFFRKAIELGLDVSSELYANPKRKALYERLKKSVLTGEAPMPVPPGLKEIFDSGQKPPMPAPPYIPKTYVPKPRPQPPKPPPFHLGNFLAALFGWVVFTLFTFLILAVGYSTQHYWVLAFGVVLVITGLLNIDDDFEDFGQCVSVFTFYAVMVFGGLTGFIAIGAAFQVDKPAQSKIVTPTPQATPQQKRKK